MRVAGDGVAGARRGRTCSCPTWSCSTSACPGSTASRSPAPARRRRRADPDAHRARRARRARRGPRLGRRRLPRQALRARGAARPHAGAAAPAPAARQRLRCAVGDLRLNPDTREVSRGDRAIELTAREFELLEHLMRNERLVVSRQALLDEVWGYDPFARRTRSTSSSPTCAASSRPAASRASCTRCAARATSLRRAMRARLPVR